MPRKSLRQEVLHELEDFFMRTQVQNLLHMLSDNDEGDVNTIQLVMQEAIESAYDNVHRMFVSRPTARPTSEDSDSSVGSATEV